jgi:hypothetical protein
MDRSLRGCRIALVSAQREASNSTEGDAVAGAAPRVNRHPAAELHELLGHDFLSHCVQDDLRRIVEVEFLH